VHGWRSDNQQVKTQIGGVSSYLAMKVRQLNKWRKWRRRFLRAVNIAHAK
jgi:hypothetical protein